MVQELKGHFGKLQLSECHCPCSALLTEEEQEWEAGAGCVGEPEDSQSVNSGWVQLMVPDDKGVVLWMAELLWLSFMAGILG